MFSEGVGVTRLPLMSVVEVTLASAAMPGATIEGELENVPVASREFRVSPGLRTPEAGADIVPEVVAELDVEGEDACSFEICALVVFDDCAWIDDVWAKAGAAPMRAAAVRMASCLERIMKPPAKSG